MRVYNTLLTLNLQAFFFELCHQGNAKNRVTFSEKKERRAFFFFTFSKFTFFSRILWGAGFRFCVEPCEHGSLSVFFRTGRSKKVDFSFDPFAEKKKKKNMGAGVPGCSTRVQHLGAVPGCRGTWVQYQGAVPGVAHPVRGGWPPHQGAAPGCSTWVQHLGAVPGCSTWVQHLGAGVPGWSTWVQYLGAVPGCSTWVQYLGAAQHLGAVPGVAHPVRGGWPPHPERGAAPRQGFHLWWPTCVTPLQSSSGRRTP